jgi:uncharacterized membrane protein
MNVQFTHPLSLLLLPLVLGWVVWWFRESDVQIGPWRRWIALFLRLMVVLAAMLAVAGLQWLWPIEGLNVFFLLDRSDSIPANQQEAARRYVNQAAAEKKNSDRVGVLVFGTEAALESSAAEQVNLDSEKVLAVVGTERTDIAAGIRLGTAAFPETGQKRLVLVSDGNENIGDALTALLSARSLGVSLDVIPVGVARGHDVALQRLGLPARVKQGAAFEAKIFVETDRPQKATVRLYRNDQPLHDQEVELAAGKNLFSFPQQLTEPGFYNYTAFLETEGDTLPQNNKATGFIHVRGEPRILLISSSANLAEDQPLLSALRSSRLNVEAGGPDKFPASLAEMTSYDALFICNLSAGDLGRDNMLLLESAVRDFGVGLVCVGGDQTYAAGGYRATPLESTLPVNMELDSKKVLPNGAIVLIMHGMEFANGNQVARDCALGVLESLGPQDELGVLLWDGRERWLFELTKVSNKKALGQKIAGMNQGDLGSFQGIMTQAHQALARSSANLKHIVVFSDGDPGSPSLELMQQIVADRITVSTVLIAGHAGPDTMEWIAFQGRGRFYDVNNPANLPQIFVKEAAVILKSAIFEEPFKPQLAVASEVVQGISAAEYPTLYGYVSTTPKTRAEIPLLSQKGDPILAHWQYGLGRAVAFTSDAKARWAKDWLAWDRYRQFWIQIAQWSLRRVENAEFSTDISVDQGQGHVLVEALDEKGDYRNFVNLQAVVVDPKGEQQTVRLKQTGPGRYESDFPTRAIGPYLLNIMEIQDGRLVGAQVVGTSINYSPEFNDATPNLSLLRRLAESGGGRLLDPATPGDNPFFHDRQRTFQPQDLWPWLLQFAVLLFVLDVGVRRIQLEREQIQKALAWTTQTILFWRGQPRPVESDESLAALLARRDQVRQQHAQPAAAPDPNLFRPQKAPGPEAPSVSPWPSQKPEAPAETTPPPAPPAPISTTSRLLEAKRRAQKRLDK